MTPHASGGQPAPPREHPIPRRSSYGTSLRELRESGLPKDYIQALDEKRRQLDDSIWKYIASKEREYKNFEKELKQKRRASQGQDGEGSGNGRKRKGSVEEKGDGAVDPTAEVTERTVGTKTVRNREKETMDRTSIAGLKDRSASLERDKDFVGVFTPNFLPALSDGSHDHNEGPAILSRTSSNPEQLLPEAIPNDLFPGHVERMNSDSLVHTTKKNRRPSQLVLQHRTSSSGSSADGRLASAMKSPKQQQQPKRKRVSLAVGDAIVAPSDNVPVSFSGHSHVPSHSRIRQAFTSEQQFTPSAEQMELRTSVANQIIAAEQTAVATAKSHHESEERAWPPPPPLRVGKTDIAITPSMSEAKSKIDADGDLFDLEQEEDAAHPLPAEDSDDLEDAVRDDEHIPDAFESASTSATSNPIFTPKSGEGYDPTTGMIPEPEARPDSAVPYLSGSEKTSKTPTAPGFRRPSVVRDPVVKGAGYQAAEEEAVEDETYGSSYVRPHTKGSFTPGSLGESFMEKNAEQMSRLREERQQRTAQVRS